MEYLVDWYKELASSSELTYQEIDAWNRLTHKNLTSWEVDVLRSLDRIRYG